MRRQAAPLVAAPAAAALIDPPAPLAALIAPPLPGDIGPIINIALPIIPPHILNPLLPAPIPLLPIPHINNNNPFDPHQEMAPRMWWILAYLGHVIGNVPLMHRLAITTNDETCYRFSALIHALPPGEFGGAERAELHAAVVHIGRTWATGGELPAPPAAALPAPPAAPAINIVMPAAGPHVSNAVYELRDKHTAMIGKFDALRRPICAAIYAQGTAQLQTQHMRNYLVGLPGHTYNMFSDADVKYIMNVEFFSPTAIRPAEVYAMRRKINSRLIPGPLPTELDAITQAATWLAQYCNQQLGQLLIDFIPRAIAAMQLYAPLLECSPTELMMTFLNQDIFPLFALPSTAEAPIYPVAAAAADAFLVKQDLINSLVMIEKAKAIAARGHTGALPTVGSQRANNGAGGGGGGQAAPPQTQPPPAPLPPGQLYHNAPGNNVRPVEWTAGALPPYPHPASGVSLCYPSRSTFGRCPYNTCQKQHDWSGITAPEQTAIKAWLILWLKKRRWDQFVTWSNSGGIPGNWPAICG